jgi:FAD/FMN-containing dehydrogenase
VRTYDIKFTDNAAFFHGLRTLLRRGELDETFGQWWLPGETGNVYHIQAAAYYNEPPDDAHLLRGIDAPVTIADTSYLDYVQRVDFLIDHLRELISWDDLIKPWYDVWLNDSEIERYVGDVIPTLTQPDVGAGGFVLLFPQLRSQLRRPFLSLPADDGSDFVYLFDILTSSNQPGPDAAFVDRMLARNRTLFDKARAVGGTRYPISSIPFDHADWVRQYGPKWPEFARRKKKYDPDSILTPGPGIFG